MIPIELENFRLTCKVDRHEQNKENMVGEWRRQWEEERKTADEIARKEARRQWKREWEEKRKKGDMAKKCEEEEKEYEARINDDLDNMRKRLQNWRSEWEEKMKMEEPKRRDRVEE